MTGQIPQNQRRKDRRVGGPQWRLIKCACVEMHMGLGAVEALSAQAGPSLRGSSGSAVGGHDALRCTSATTLRPHSWQERRLRTRDTNWSDRLPFLARLVSRWQVVAWPLHRGGLISFPAPRADCFEFACSRGGRPRWVSLGHIACLSRHRAEAYCRGTAPEYIPSATRSGGCSSASGSPAGGETRPPALAPPWLCPAQQPGPGLSEANGRGRTRSVGCATG